MTRAKRYGIKINLVVCSAGTGVERLQVEIPVHWPIQWLRWEMRIELGRQQWGFWLRKHICDTVKLERILGQTMYGRWGRGSIAPRPQARVPGRDLTGASPPTTDLMTLHHNCLSHLHGCLRCGPQRSHADVALSPSKHQNMPPWFAMRKAWGQSLEDPTWSHSSSMNLTYDLNWVTLITEFWMFISKRDKTLCA